MSSNIRVKRICEYCEMEFTAKTTVTKYCGDTCAKRAYKARKRTAKISESKKETKQKIIKPILELKAKEFLSIPEASQLLGVSKRTIYRLLQKGELSKGKLGSRTILRRIDINRIFE